MLAHFGSKTWGSVSLPIVGRVRLAPSVPSFPPPTLAMPAIPALTICTTLSTSKMVICAPACATAMSAGEPVQTGPSNPHDEGSPLRIWEQVAVAGLQYSGMDRMEVLHSWLKPPAEIGPL